MDRNEGPSSLETAQREAGSNHGHPILQTVGALGYANPREISQSSRARHWTDSIPLEFHYTAGVAGEEFRRELKKNGRFLASKCAKCKNSYVPARMFCPTCFIEIKDTRTIDEDRKSTRLNSSHTVISYAVFCLKKKKKKKKKSKIKKTNKNAKEHNTETIETTSVVGNNIYKTRFTREER